MKTVLTPPWRVQRFDRLFWKDVVVNVLGFVPFGFAVYAWLRINCRRTPRSAIVAAVLLGGAISLAIELLQVYLPTRDSSLTDVTDNVLGTWIGALICRTADRIAHR